MYPGGAVYPAKVNDSTAKIAEGSHGQRPGLELTLGVEEEYHLVDLETRRLVARAPELLANLQRPFAALAAMADVWPSWAGKKCRGVRRAGR